MIIKLRDRRRQQTAREIQVAALQLSLRDGYATLTTDQIAAEAGISPRTFFNYYQNKQAALLGEPPELDCDCADWIVTSDRPLIADLAQLAGSVIEKNRLDRQIVRMMEQIWDSTPELVTVFRNSMDNIALMIGTVLQKRLGPGHKLEATLLAELVTHALTHAVRVWAIDDAMDASEIPGLVEQQLISVAKLLH
jgi:AcrR family transcriptional regulator